MQALFPAGITAQLSRRAAQIMTASALMVLFCASAIAQGATADVAINSEFRALATSSQPTYIDTGDFDNDGAPDVAVLSWSDRSVTLHRFNRAARSFRPAQRTPLAITSGAVDFALADFTQDGKLDVAVATESDGIVILAGNGDGTLNEVGQRYVSAQRIYTLDAGTIDANTTPDLLAAHAGGVTSLLNTGTGAFRLVFTALPETYSTAYAARLGDFDGNSTRDAVVIACCRPGTTSYFWVLYRMSGLGNGEFGTPTSMFPPDVPERSTRILADDLTVIPGTAPRRDTVLFSDDSTHHPSLYTNLGLHGASTTYRWDASAGIYREVGFSSAVGNRGLTGNSDRASVVAMGPSVPAAALYEKIFRSPGWFDENVHLTYVGPFGFEAQRPWFSGSVRADLTGDGRDELIISDWTNARLYVRGLDQLPYIPCDATGAQSFTVKICTLEDGATVGSPLRVVAHASGQGGYDSISSYRIYVDGTQVYWSFARSGESAPQLDATLRLPDGQHTIVVEAHFTGSEYARATRTVTVSNSLGASMPPAPAYGCSAPASGVRICSPADGDSYAEISPMLTEVAHISAAASSSSPIRYMIIADDVNGFLYYQRGNRVEKNLHLDPSTTRIFVQAHDEAGNVLEQSVSVNVTHSSNQSPTAVLNVTPTSGTAPMAVQASLLGSSDPDGDTLTGTVDFGDGTVIDAMQASHTYSSPGTYTVSGTVKDPSGATASKTATVTVGAATGCAAPASGVVICTPADGSTVGSPVRITAAAGSSSAIQYMQVYVDGRKAHEQAGGQLDASVPMDPGTRRVTVQAGDAAGNLLKKTIYVNVQAEAPAGCTAAPNSVNICTPTDGGTSASPVRLTAAAAGSGTIQYMQVYVDGRKAHEQSGGQLDTSLSMTEGTRRITVQAGDAAGNLLKKTIHVTVQPGSTTPTCTADPNTVKICTPAAGATQTSPVRVVAMSNSANPVRYMQVWVDGVRQYHVEAAQVDTSLAMPAGSRRLVVTAVDSTGAVMKSTIYITVN